ncbi:MULTISPECIES: hypothetical protein [unclassified Streptomyces]
MVITKGKKKGRHPSPATAKRILREHDERSAATKPVVELDAAESA